MKLIRSRIATTHLDRHNERMTREALEDMAKQHMEHYIPVMWNHDIRRPPLGRSISAEVVQLDDGEYALDSMAELWEEGDTLETIGGDGRALRLKADQDVPTTFAVRYDRSFLDPEGASFVREIAAVPCQESETVCGLS